jgi:ATP-dependent exoDNAse (exonuclease V) beta subunit
MLAVLRESTACFTPECCQEPSERRHYRRCLDHLFSLANERFGASGATLACVLDWLCVQIATNETEDEPTRQGDAESVHHKEREYPVLAVTVHSAKGQEYRNVIIAQTARKFDTRPPGLRAITMLEVDGQNQPAQIRCLWQLADKSNFHQNDAEAKNLIATVDDRVDREEARLLYVAMTRAISKLVVFRTVTREMSWGKLLEGAVP